MPTPFDEPLPDRDQQPTAEPELEESLDDLEHVAGIRWGQRNLVLAALGKWPALVTAITILLLLGFAVAWGLAGWALREAERAEVEKQHVLDSDARTRQKEKEALENERRQGQARLEHERRGRLKELETLENERRLRLKKVEELESEARVKQKEAQERATDLARARSNLFTAQLMRVAAVYEKDPCLGYELLHDLDACPIDLRDFAWGWYARQCRRDLLTLVGHTGAITSVAFSPDGKTLASGSRILDEKTGGYVGGELKVWDVATGQECATLKGHTSVVTSVAFSSDGQTLASGRTDATIQLWDVATGQKRAALKGGGGPLAFSPDGRILASANYDKTIQLWEVATRQERTILKGHTGAITSVAFSPDGKTLASGSSRIWDVKKREDVGGELKLWDVATGRERIALKGHTSVVTSVPLSSRQLEVTSVAFSPDGKTLASGSALWDAKKSRYAGGEIKLWDAATGQERGTLLGHTNVVTSVAFSSDGKTLASGSYVADATIQLWDVATGQKRAALKGGGGPLAFSPDGQTLASASYDKTIQLWDVATRQERALKGHTGAVTSVAFSPDGKTLASGSQEGKRVLSELKLWEVATGQERATLKGHKDKVTSVAFSPDGKTLASGSRDPFQPDGEGELKLWDVVTGQERAALKGHTSEVASVAFSPDGKTLASGSRERFKFDKHGELKLWDVVTGQERAALKGHTSGVTSVAFSPDGKTLASGSAIWNLNKRRYAGGEIKLWDVVTGQERVALTGHTGSVWSVAFSSDGKTLASGSGDSASPGEIKLWDVVTGQERAALKGHTDWVHSVAFSPDGKTLASGSADATIKLWDVATGQERATLKGHLGPVTSVAFSGDGKTLASANGRMIKLWEALITNSRATTSTTAP